MKILVTGGTGFIGSHTAVELQQQGFEVLIVDDLSNSTAEVADRIGMITGTKPPLHVFDLCDAGKTEDLFIREEGIAAVIHFAAHKSVGESVQQPLKYYRNNLLSTVNLLESMARHGVKHLIFSSSCTVYGQPDELPVTEHTPLKRAESPYGNTKKIMEDIISDTVKTADVAAISLRYFNPTGAHESALIGEAPSGIPDNLVPYITQTAIGARSFLRVFGDDYDTPDGTPIRDYIHVVDLAKAHVVALKRMLDGKCKDRYEVFNLGTGRGYSVMEVIKAFERVSGMNLNYQVVARRPGDIVKIWADPSYANRELGWKAEKGLDDMMGSAWNWEQAGLHLSTLSTDA
ncbi:MAG: UDP-glucose 4-epimerase GalE [Bacteroidales bacterium]|nr:UDP-glucose 4-epimerase GalE [Bacteroidales bacterium]